MFVLFDPGLHSTWRSPLLHFCIFRGGFSPFHAQRSPHTKTLHCCSDAAAAAAAEGEKTPGLRAKQLHAYITASTAELHTAQDRPAAPK